MIAKLKIGRKVVSHVFEKDGSYMWCEGAPYKNKGMKGYSYVYMKSAFNGALIYARRYAKYFGGKEIVVEYHDKKKSIILLDNLKNK